MRLPKLPSSVYSVLGQIPVNRPQALLDRDEKETGDLGEWDGKERTISVRSDLSPVTAWQTLLHEKVHMWLFDAGVQPPAPYEEMVCDVVATALLAEMLKR